MFFRRMLKDELTDTSYIKLLSERAELRKELISLQELKKNLVSWECVALGNEAASYQIKGMVIITQPQSKDKIKVQTIKVQTEAS